ncbi:Helicase conserved C-terminal domain-containing protein [Cribrihabitans marinus]|uniref:Helicase conserved C-terminal domain-containing protein n=1 Tax=Cribrihabitans marinus TaxID=1227549 RepID=A0A1H7E198_9RHOB|nr:helicase-related protein [Cribrihabitans marinus]GGH40122.1 helicase [Cribrihabitans marinus]SEK05330.1 Helicase conserved C-terminal domain-containing protein [Cribrihabitans marinus]
MTDRFVSDDALRPLKAFQRKTVDYVAKRLLSDTDAVRHFLVADEVGLGKTMVARGVIARTIEALQDSVPRIDIVYICSNGAIAKQNVARLNVMGGERTRVLPTRLTMLALELAKAGGIKREGVNFFSLTPGTSLDLKQGGGMKQERALILRLIWNMLDDRRAVARMLQGYAGAAGWRQTRAWIDQQPVEPQIAARFENAVAARPDLLQELEACAQCYKGLRRNDTDLNRRREGIVGQLRTILARESAEALEPDLIVLDEFQRFTELLHGEGEAADLARKLFDAIDPDGNQSKVLLLSATPYRMLSLRDDEADAGDHYREFLDVLSFLFGHRGPSVRAELETEMRRYRLAMQGLPASFDDACAIKTGIEDTLRSVIARTERVAETADRDAMMRDVDVPVTVEPADLIEARAVARVADAADAPGTVEYWKSAPYLLSFLRDYKLGQRLDHLKDAPGKALLAAIRDAGSAQINMDSIESYRPIPENNGRMRALKEIAFRDDMAKRLWMPPSLPYFGPRVTASKMLIFSQWAMVPDAIAALLSYDSERMMGMGRTGRSYTARHPQLLNFRRNRDRLTGLRALPLVIPSPTLASTVDPLEIFRSSGPLPDASAMRKHAIDRLQDLASSLEGRLRAVQRGGFTAHMGDGETETDDENLERALTWDWACAAALDVRSETFATWLATGDILTDIVRADGQDAWHDHLNALSAAARADTLHGQPDRDRLVDHVADLALGSPATCALRALRRVVPTLDLDHPAMLNAATRIGMAFRGLFNQPESLALLRTGTDDVYWQTVLHHCAEHDLQSVLDEYLHVLMEAEGLMDAEPAYAVAVLAETVDDALSLKPAQIEIKRYRAHRDRLEITPGVRMRGRFATRLLQQGQEDGAQRTDTVRTAFNSPFRPFVLASTSVGQEGLDFHPYCHRLVHWNLPSNPVDLEQREGRVHRYKNHAVRLNLAARFEHTLRSRAPVGDPWRSMFHTAHDQAVRPGDMEPFWLLDGPTGIERFALSLPYSRETALLGWLKRSVALYRLAFGQPRQDDLISFLEGLDRSVEHIDLSELQISLRPV